MSQYGLEIEIHQPPFYTNRICLQSITIQGHRKARSTEDILETKIRMIEKSASQFSPNELTSHWLLLYMQKEKHEKYARMITYCTNNSAQLDSAQETRSVQQRSNATTQTWVGECDLARWSNPAIWNQKTETPEVPWGCLWKTGIVAQRKYSWREISLQLTSFRRFMICTMEEWYLHSKQR